MGVGLRRWADISMFPIGMYLDPKWIIIVVLASSVYGLLSSVISARRMYFLAGSLPHSALLAVTLSIIAVNIVGGWMDLWSLLIGIALTTIVAYLLSRNVDPDTATAVFVSLSVSLTVISMYYVLSFFQVKSNLWAFILGDPLLSTWDDVGYLTFVSTVTLMLILPFMREHVFIGVDRDFVRLSGVKAELYDAMFMVALAISTVGMLRVVGFVMEHVVLLLPGTIASMSMSTGRRAVILSVLVSLASGVLGLILGVLSGLSPSGLVGLVLLSLYLFSLIRGGK